ncbi:MAG TPA: hypothetical protein VFV63_04030, partial [Ilumatobacteraceae bacterium]|nr:hypothetical protein [Ilumatobacteraceae bacterium]
DSSGVRRLQLQAVGGTIAIRPFLPLTIGVTMPTFTMPSLFGLDLSKLDLSKVQLPKFDMSNVQLPKFDMPKFDLPKFDVSKVDVPKVDVDRLGDLARDTAYAGVGLVAVTLQKAAERGREIQTEITTRARQLADAIA